MRLTLRAMIPRERIGKECVVLKGCGTELKLPNSQFLLGLVLSDSFLLLALASYVTTYSLWMKGVWHISITLLLFET